MQISLLPSSPLSNSPPKIALMWAPLHPSSAASSAHRARPLRRPSSADHRAPVLLPSSTSQAHCATAPPPLAELAVPLTL